MVTLRMAQASDAEAIASIYAPYVRDTAASFEAEVPAADEMRLRIESTLQRLPWWVAEDPAGQIIGYAYAARHRERAAYRWAVETSVYLHPSAQGQGIGTRLYQVLFEQLAALGYMQALALITLPNPGSVRLHESMGFVPVGVMKNIGFKLGAWRDLGWWQKSLAALPAAPAEPLPGPAS